MNKTIERTNNYSLFKKLKGNRDIAPKRIQKIIESINSVGYITSPIIVNEKYEIIDGQGRFEALKELGLPVEYVIHKGAGIDECLSMNIHQSNWTITDYVKSYAERGIKSYIYLKELMDLFPSINVLNLVMACSETTKRSYKIYKGELLITEEQYNKAIKKLEYVVDIVPKIKYLNGSINPLVSSILICYSMEDVDLDRLKDKLLTESNLMTPWNSVPTCLQSIEDIYNKNLGYPIFIYTEYRKSLYAKYNGFVRKEKYTNVTYETE